MLSARAYVHRRYEVGEVDRRLFGGFVEHIGRCVYTGVYEPGHPCADEEGFRRDVAELVRGLDMPVTRYPGGNFVSGYDWKDTVGPRSGRPVRADYAWSALEPNQFGLDEFVRWCRVAGTSPMLAVNLGTGTAKSAQELVEYCNFPRGTAWSDLRRQNGAEEPHGIRLWCLGNEMDGPWQIGHKTAAEYGRVALEAGRMMKLADPSIELVVCGSSGSFMPTFGAWESEVLKEAYDIADYVSYHAYFSCADHDRAGFFAMPDKLGRDLDALIATCDAVAASLRQRRKVNISLDEWNIWYRGDPNAHPETKWLVARPINEETYDMADVVVTAGLLMSMLERADRVKVACLAQSVNIIAPIMTRPGGGCWRQTTYYPFQIISRHGRGTVLRSVVDTPTYETAKSPEPVGLLKLTCVLSQDGSELTVFALNRSLDEELSFELELAGFAPTALLEATEMHHDDLDAVNTEDCERVRPEAMGEGRAAVSGTALTATLRAASFAMFRLSVK